MSKSNGKAAEPLPRFDFSGVSRKWNKEFLASISKAGRATVAMQRPTPSDPDAAQAHFDKLEQAINDLEQISEDQAALICQVLADVPAEWLITGAPSGLDWSLIESLDWIRADKYGEILEMLQTGRAMAEGEAKN